MARLSPEAILNFAGERADLAWQLSRALPTLLSEAQLDSVMRELEMPLMPVLADIERAGILIDGPALASRSRHIEQELARYTARIYELAGEEFNINSPPQLGRILFEKLELPSAKKTGKTRSFSTAAEVLEELALTHELPRLVLEWRALHKLKSTYIDALPVMVDPATGRVHTSFNQAVAATGRLSSSDPNLQNIPIRTELGREIRRAFVAAPGHVLISADYSQIELRVLAHMAGEEALIEAFRAGEDIHERTGLKLFGVNNAMDKHQLRSLSKMVNYAVLYGKTPFTLAKDINVTQEAAQEFITAYFTGFPRVRAFIDSILEEGRTTGVVRTMFGRRRLVPNLTSRNFQMRSQAERETVNMPIQGTAADILKKAMIDLHAELPEARALDAHDPDRARRAALRGSERGSGGGRGGRPRPHGARRHAGRAPHCGRRHRRELARRKALVPMRSVEQATPNRRRQPRLNAQSREMRGGTSGRVERCGLETCGKKQIPDTNNRNPASPISWFCLKFVVGWNSIRTGSRNPPLNAWNSVELNQYMPPPNANIEIVRGRISLEEVERD